MINNPEKYETFKKNLKKIHLLTNMETKDKTISTKYFNRGIGAEILQNIFKGGVEYLYNGIDFLHDDCCEYAYELDLDTNTLNIYISGNNLYKSIPFSEINRKTMDNLEHERNKKW